MTFVFLAVLRQDELCQDLGEHGIFRLRQRLAISLRLSQEGLRLFLAHVAVVAHLSCCHVGALDSVQNSGDLRQFVSHRSRTRCDHLDAG
jgi:hypothetical protein